MSSSVDADFLVAFFIGLGTSAAETGATFMDLSGLGSFDADQGDQSGENAPGVEAFGALGLLGRFLPPDEDGEVEIYAVRLGDRVVPLGFRDLRIDRAFPSGLAEGSIALAGYGGGFHSIDLTSANSGDQRANIHVIYAPYEFSGGTPAKAHAVILDPEAGGLQLVHGDGYFLAMQDGEGIRMSADAGTFLQIKPGQISMGATSVSIAGNVAVGANPAAAVPLLPGVASPPSSSFFVSP